MSVRPATRALIEEAHRYGAVYRGGFASHLPMALVALDAMGADDARIAQFSERYSRQHLEPLDPAGPYAAAVRGIEERLAADGSRAVLRQWLDRLAPAAGGAAFHGLIRTAYAIESGSEAELARALAYWELVGVPMDIRPPPCGSVSPQMRFADMSRELRGQRFPGASIAARMGAAARDARFTGWCADVDAGATDLEQLAPVLIRAYAATGNFTLLHGVTGCHAARVVAPFSPDPAGLARAFWVAIVAAYAGEGAPSLASVEPAADATWKDVLAQAVHAQDEHDIKLVYTCWREWQRSRDDMYLHVAAAVTRALQIDDRVASR